MMPDQRWELACGRAHFLANAQSAPDVNRWSVPSMTSSHTRHRVMVPAQPGHPDRIHRCDIDGTPCQPDGNPVEFLYPQFCCDTRSFHWVAQNVPAGSHTVEILWGMGNPTSASVT